MSGKLAEYYDPSNETPFFRWIGLAAVITGAVILALTKPISRLMRGVR